MSLVRKKYYRTMCQNELNFGYVIFDYIPNGHIERFLKIFFENYRNNEVFI